jgi:hypothetical protein
MNKYNCDRCGFSTQYRGNFKKHIFRKNVCKPKLEDINIDEIRKKYGFNKHSELTPKHSELTPKHSELTPKKLKYHCEYCNKSFTRLGNKKRHIKSRCSLKQKDINNLQNILLEKENENEKLKNILLEKENENKEIKNKMEKQISEIKNEMKKQIEILLEKVGNNNITINNNIQLNNYGNESMVHVTRDFLKKLIKMPYTSIPKLIENIHFNKEVPENKNIRITNKKLPYAEVFKDNKWKLCNKIEVVNEILTNKSKILDNEFIEIKDDLQKETSNKYNTFKKDRDWDIFTRKKVLKNAEIAILNGSKLKT